MSNHNRSNSSGPMARGSIEKTNMMSSENPFVDPARPYEQLQPSRSIASITSPRRSTGAVNKSLNLSDENPFHAIYGGYRYPSQIDPSKRITNPNATARPIENKSVNLSDENPFFPTYGRYQPSSQIETPRPAPLMSNNESSESNRFNTYRPSLIREYSDGIGGNGFNSFSSSIADWTRNNPAPLSFRPIQVQRPPPEFYNQRETANKPTYIPPGSPPRQQRQIPPAASPPKAASPVQKPTSTAPLDKTSMNMSPDNPFADTYGRYYYPSSNEIKAQKRAGERSARLVEQQPIKDNRPPEPMNQMTEHPEREDKEVKTAKANGKFARFDVTF